MLQGLQVLVTGLVLGVPLSPLLAVWAAVWNLVPQLGGAIGGIVFVLVAFTQGATTGIIAGVIFMVYLTFANNVLLPVILGKAVDISPLTTMVATIAGFSIGGIIGAMLAVPADRRRQGHVPRGALATGGPTCTATPIRRRPGTVQRGSGASRPTRRRGRRPRPRPPDRGVTSGRARCWHASATPRLTDAGRARLATASDVRDRSSARK